METTITVNVSDLKSAVSTVSKSAASPKDGRIALECVQLIVRDGLLELAAADGFRLSIARVAIHGGTWSDTPALVNAKVFAAAVRGLKGSLVTLEYDKDGAAVDGLSLATVDATFPDYRMIVPHLSNAQTHVTLEREAWINALEPIKPVDRKRGTKPGMVHIFMDTARTPALALTASETAHVYYQRTPESHVSGAGNQISFNAQFLLDMLKSAPKSAEIRLHVKNGNCAARIDVGENVTHVVMPIVIGEEHIPTPDVWPALEKETDFDSSEYAPFNMPRYHAVDTGMVHGPAVPELCVTGCGRFVKNEYHARCTECLDALHAMPAGAVNILDLVPTRDETRAAYEAPPVLKTREYAPAPIARFCSECGTPHEPNDKFCAECGTKLGTYQAAVESAESLENWAGFVPIVQKYRGKNPARIYDACPNATDVRGFKDWLRAGRVVRKGERAIVIMAPIGRGNQDADDAAHEDADGTVDERRPRVKKAYVFDISQTEKLVPKAKQASPTTHETATLAAD